MTVTLCPRVSCPPGPSFRLISQWGQGDGDSYAVSPFFSPGTCHTRLARETRLESSEEKGTAGGVRALVPRGKQTTTPTSPSCSAVYVTVPGHAPAAEVPVMERQIVKHTGPRKWNCLVRPHPRTAGTPGSSEGVPEKESSCSPPTLPCHPHPERVIGKETHSQANEHICNRTRSSHTFRPA